MSASSPGTIALTARSGDVVRRTAPATVARLTPGERDRWQRLRGNADRDDFLAAHLLVRECAARLTGAPSTASVTISQTCPRCGGPHGRPTVAGRPDVHATLSHSGGVVAAAAGFGPVGIDVETRHGPGRLDPSEFAAVLTPAESAAVQACAEPDLALLRTWVRKEAFVKAGAVELEDLATFDLSSLPAAEPAPGLLRRAGRRAAWSVHDWTDPVLGALGALVSPAGAPVSWGPVTGVDGETPLLFRLRHT